MAEGNFEIFKQDEETKNDENILNDEKITREEIKKI
jgi:hypothetical protein